MKTYKIYVNGMYVGTEDFTRSEVTAIESDQDIKLIEKQKGAGKDMEERIKELEKELEKVCGTYENDCSKCPKQAECEEY